MKTTPADNKPSKGNRETEGQSCQRNRVTEPTEKKTIHTRQRIPLLASRVATLPQAVKLSLEGGLKSNSLFIFCRALKAFEITTGVTLPSKELDNAFAGWWSEAHPLMPDGSDFDECRYEFQRTFQKTRTPLGSNPLEEAIRMADDNPFPVQAERYQSAKIKRLIAVCAQLQSIAGDAAFFLGVRDAAAILGTKKGETGAIFMQGLVSDNILTLIQKGTPGGSRASRYRFNP